MSSRIALLLLFILAGINAWAQSGNSTSISGTVVDPSGAVVEGATVQVENPVSQFVRSTTTDSAGKFTVPNVPFNPYHLTVRGRDLRRTHRMSKFALPSLSI
jgi:hypothetical protein